MGRRKSVRPTRYFQSQLRANRMKTLRVLTQARFWNSWKSLIYILISAGVAGIIYASNLDKDPKTNTFYSITIFFLCHIFVSQLFGEFFIEELRRELEELKNSSDRAVKEQVLTGKIRNGFQSLKTMDRLIGAAGQATAESMIKRLVVDPESQKLALVGRDFAYLCYSKFWASLVDFQATWRSPATLVARMTHTSDINSWADEYMNFMSQSHLRFKDLGGYAFRILIDRRPRGTSDLSPYLNLIEKMSSDGVDVVYLNRDCDGFPRSVLRADFCVVNDIGDHSEEAPHYALRWKLRDADVKGVTITRSIDKFRTHDREWDLLERALARADYSKDSQDQDLVSRLNHYRDVFIARSRESRRRN